MNKTIKTILWIIGGFLSVSIFSTAINNNSPQPDTANSTAPIVRTFEESDNTPALSATTTKPATETKTTPAASSTVDTYTNVDGNTVQSPTYYDSAPSGASAQCRDSTYSFSQHRSGTCSHHGGVANWL